MSTTVITNVRVFEGSELSTPTTVAFVDGRIASVATASDAVHVDANGGVLLPGFIDAHAHVDAPSQLEVAAAWGVTTLCDMGSRDLAVLASLRDRPGKPTLLSAGYPASAPGALAEASMGFPAESTVQGPDDVVRFVVDRKAAGADYIKVLVEDARIPGSKPLSQETVAALATAAREAGLKTIAHIVSVDTLRIALQAEVDIVTHTALDGELSEDIDRLVRRRPVVLVPTLVMMQGLITRVGGRFTMRVVGFLIPRARLRYATAEATVRLFLRAGKVVLAGTDANDDPTTPYRPEHGKSLHEELERLVRAGLSPVDALRSTTSEAARVFGLSDRGTIAAGLRADAVLVDGDPTTDISTTRNIAGVWIGGERIEAVTAPPPSMAR